MKKLNYLVLPLLAVPFLASCGCSKTNYKVSESEFNSAIALEGVKYVQNRSLVKKGNEEVEADATVQISPTACYLENEVSQANNKSKPSTYSKLVGEDSVTYTQKYEGGDWSEDKTITLSDARRNNIFFVPADASIKLTLEDLLKTDLKFADYTYIAKDKAYFAYYEDSKTNEDTSGTNVYISFRNKKITSAKFEMLKPDGSLFTSGEFTYTYKTLTPKDPRK